MRLRFEWRKCLPKLKSIGFKPVLAKSLVLLLLLPLACWAQAQSAVEPDQGQAAQRTWKICLGEVSIPPFLNDGSGAPGLSEQLLLDSARLLGLHLEFHRYPGRRCRLLLKSGEMHAMAMAPTPENLAQWQFPLHDGGVDAAKRVVRLSLVGIKRSDADFDWDGKTLQDPASQLRVGGALAGRMVASDILKKLGLKVDGESRSTRQLMLKLQARRIDLAILFREELPEALSVPAAAGLSMLSRPLLATDIYLVSPVELPAARQEQLEALWEQLAKRRELSQYKPR